MDVKPILWGLWGKVISKELIMLLCFLPKGVRVGMGLVIGEEMWDDKARLMLGRTLKLASW